MPSALAQSAISEQLLPSEEPISACKMKGVTVRCIAALAMNYISFQVKRPIA